MVGREHKISSRNDICGNGWPHLASCCHLQFGHDTEARFLRIAAGIRYQSKEDVLTATPPGLCWNRWSSVHYVCHRRGGCLDCQSTPSVGGSPALVDQRTDLEAVWFCWKTAMKPRSIILPSQP